MLSNTLDVSFPGILAPIRQEFDRLVPTTFAIETSLVCNLKCPECAMGGNLIDRRKGLLAFDQFKVMADKIRPFAKLIYLHLWGEPMLNPEIFSMIRYAAPFARTHISTNALTLNRETAEELVKSGVSEILVSIDGITQETYEIYRVGGSLKQAMDALILLQGINAAYGSKVKLVPQFIVFKHNQHEMQRFNEFCGALGLKPSFKAPYIRNPDSHLRWADDPRYVRPHFPTVEALKRAMAECSNPKDVFTILLDGSVVACCHDFKRATCFGNIFEHNLLDIWNCPDFRQFRWDILSGKAPQFCIDACMSYFLNKPGEQWREAARVQRKASQAQLKIIATDGKKTDQEPRRRMENFHRLDVGDPANAAFYDDLISKPDKFGLHGLVLDGKNEQQKRELILGEYYAQVAVRAGKIASDLLFKGQWTHETPEWFDHRHHLLNTERWFTDFWTASADNVIPVLPLGGKMLNLCSGDGFYDYYFYRKRASEIVCIEINEEAYRLAKRLHSAENIRYIKANVLTWDPPESYFDVVIIRGAIEHFAPQDQAIIFQSAARALKPGGWFCGDTPAKKTGGKHLSWHQHEWADEAEMRNALSTCFNHVQTGTLASKEVISLFWRCRKR
jgi:MoaA/NifB/PqqE/SkfB family radical SAM enzyme/SAM-dependent methyltransferase